MKFYDATFIFEEKESPECSIWKQPRDGTKCIYVQFRPEGGKRHTSPNISFYLHGEQSLTNFKNKVLWAYEKFMKEKRR